MSRVAMAPRARPFDVDLGPDERGRPSAVYPLCRPLCRIYSADPGRRERAGARPVAVRGGPAPACAGRGRKCRAAVTGLDLGERVLAFVSALESSDVDFGIGPLWEVRLHRFADGRDASWGRGTSFPGVGEGYVVPGP